MTQENRREFIVKGTDVGTRLDRFLANSANELSRSRIQALIRDGFVTVNGAVPRARDIVRAGNRVILVEPPVQALDLVPEKVALSVLFEDDDLIVINKAAGISVHPGAGRKRGTLVNALLSHCKNLSGIGGKERPGIVHRLDKETSGCLAVAKNDFAHQELSRQFAARTVEKIYLALVAGKLRRGSGTIVAPIARHRVHRKRMAIAREGGREARTDFKVIRSGGEARVPVAQWQDTSNSGSSSIFWASHLRRCCLRRTPCGEFFAPNVTCMETGVKSSTDERADVFSSAVAGRFQAGDKRGVKLAGF